MLRIASIFIVLAALLLAGCSLLRVTLSFETEPQIFDSQEYITIVSDPPGARITYTIDGSEPSDASTEYVDGLGILCPSLFKFTLKAVSPGRSDVIAGDFGLKQVVTQDVAGTYDIPTALADMPADRVNSLHGTFSNMYGGETDWMQVSFTEGCSVVYSTNSAGGGGMVILPAKGAAPLASIDDDYSTADPRTYQETVTPGTVRYLVACQGIYYDAAWNFVVTTTGE